MALPAVTATVPDPLSFEAGGLYDLLPIGTCILASDGRFLAANLAYCALLGYERSELLRMSVSDITHPADVQRDEIGRADSMRAASRDGIVEKRYVRSDGQPVWVRLSLRRAALHTDGVPCVIATATPIDDLKRAQQAERLAEHERALAERARDDTQAHVLALFEQGAVGVAEIDLAGRLLAVNERYCDLMQRSREHLLGANVLELTHPDDLEQNMPLFDRLVSDGDRFEIEKRYLRPDGSQLWANVAVSLVKPADASRPQSLLAIVFDITARKKMEEALRTADRKKDEFLAMLAHELRNPLAPIAAAASLLRTGRLEAQRVPQVSEIITRQVRHMTGLVDELLDVSRVTRGVAVLELADVDLRHAIEEAVEQVRPDIEQRGHRLDLYMGERPAMVRGDPKRLVQVLVNLLDNAAKYTPNAGSIELSLRTEAREAVLRVADNGVGMNPEVLENAFELFTQAKRSIDRSQGGLGLGLALVRKLVELHHGSVVAHSAGEGEGSEFIVKLPLTMQAHDADAASGPGDVAGQRALRALVVDDNADAADTLGMLLETFGHEVRVENTPTAALRTAAQERPDVCILDIGLPEMDGNELARRIRQLPGLSNTTLIAVTGYGQEHDKRAAAEAGFDHHFVKPVAIEQLAAVLDSLERSTQEELSL